MTNTFSSLPTKIAQPLFAGRIPRMEIGTTSLFIRTVYVSDPKKQVLPNSPIQFSFCGGLQQSPHVSLRHSLDHIVNDDPSHTTKVDGALTQETRCAGHRHGEDPMARVPWQTRSRQLR